MDQQQFYVFDHGVPNTTVSFYSETGGGKIIHRSTCDENGIAKLKLSSSDPVPSFGLNASNEREDGK